MRLPEFPNDPPLDFPRLARFGSHKSRFFVGFDGAQVRLPVEKDNRNFARLGFLERHGHRVRLHKVDSQRVHPLFQGFTDLVVLYNLVRAGMPQHHNRPALQGCTQGLADQRNIDIVLTVKKNADHREARFFLRRASGFAASRRDRYAQKQCPKNMVLACVHHSLLHLPPCPDRISSACGMLQRSSAACNSAMSSGLVM